MAPTSDFFVSSLGKSVPCALIGEKKENLYFFYFFLDLRGTMEVSGTSNSFLFTSPLSVSGGNKAIVSEAKDDLNSGGQPRPGRNDLVFQSSNIVGRQVPVFEGGGPLAGFRLGNAVNVVTEKSEKNKDFCFFPDKSTRNSFAKTRNKKTLVGATSRRLSLCQIFISGAGSSSAGLPQGSRPLFLQRKS